MKITCLAQREDWKAPQGPAHQQEELYTRSKYKYRNKQIQIQIQIQMQKQIQMQIQVQMHNKWNKRTGKNAY